MHIKSVLPKLCVCIQLCISVFNWCFPNYVCVCSIDASQSVCVCSIGAFKLCVCSIGAFQSVCVQLVLPKLDKDKFDELISPDEGLFERNMLIIKHKSHLSNP